MWILTQDLEGKKKKNTCISSYTEKKINVSSTKLGSNELDCLTSIFPEKFKKLLAVSKSKISLRLDLLDLS